MSADSEKPFVQVIFQTFLYFTKQCSGCLKLGSFTTTVPILRTSRQMVRCGYRYSSPGGGGWLKGDLSFYGKGLSP